MREERRNLSGDQVIPDAIELWGKIAGNVTVEMGGKLYVRGAIYGNLLVNGGGRVHILGHISGDLTVKKGAKVIVSGIVGGDAINEGGRLYLQTGAKVMGKLKELDGETKVDVKTEFQR